MDEKTKPVLPPSLRHIIQDHNYLFFILKI